MYSVLLIIEDQELRAGLRSLPIWGEASGFEIGQSLTQVPEGGHSRA